MSERFSIAVHGGAGRLPERLASAPGRVPLDDAMRRSLAAGAWVLQRGGSAVAAVAAAVTVLEDDEHFDAGRGAVLCADGSIELSASLMDGESGAVGAMVGLKTTRNPVLGARLLLDHRHCLLFGESADIYAEDAGLEVVDDDYFRTPRRVAQWERFAERQHTHLDHSDPEGPHGTVGAVALDRQGHYAAATSTGGMVNQLAGRVGDTPVVGAGTWADRLCAVSATGTGDIFLSLAFARRVADLIELGGLSGADAADRALAEVGARQGEGGCLLIDTEGEIHAPQTTPHLVRGWLREGDPPRVAIAKDESIEVSLD